MMFVEKEVEFLSGVAERNRVLFAMGQKTEEQYIKIASLILSLIERAFWIDCGRIANG